MGVLSKLAYQLGQPVLHATCYETIHPWNTNCYGAIWDAIPDGVRFSLKTYISFYLLTNFVSKRGRLDKVDWKRFTIDVTHSASFLVVNMCLWLMFLCRMRHLVGFFTPWSMGFISSIFASAIAILFEKKTRRPALALYLTNLASETFYNSLALHGKAPLFKYGECVPFGIGLMIFTFLQTSGRLPKSFNGFMNAALKSNVTENIIDAKKLPDSFNAFLTHLRTEYTKTESCHHANSCTSHAVEGFAKNFTFGLVASSALTLVRNYRLIVNNPYQLLVMLISKPNFKMPMFAGLLPFIFNASRCSLNSIGHIPPIVNNVFSAGLASLSMVFFPNISIAMYCLWKAIETLYFDLVDRGWLPKIKNGEIILYSISTGYVLWNVIVEPSTMRRGYLNFLSGLVNGKLAFFNRRLYDHFGFFSREIYDGIPDLNTKYAAINPMLYQPLVK